MRCSDMRRTQAHPPTWYPVQQQDPRHFGVSSPYDDDTIPTANRVFSRKNTTAPYPNQDQNIDNRAETVMIVPNRAWGQFIPPQTAVRANILPHIRIVEVLT